MGDSRVPYQQGKFVQLTKDHSFVNALLDRGAISQSEEAKHSNRNMLVQAVGANIDIKMNQPSNVEMAL